MNAITTTRDAGALMEAVLIKGDLSKLSPQERSDYYLKVCESVGLNPLTKPFEYITLNSKLTLYAKRDAADQLRKVNGISIEIVEKSVTEGLLTVHVRAKDATGRTDEDLGVVSINGLKGEQAANAVLKAVTKAKRRVTLSISGLGFLDETEVEDIPAASKRPPAPAPAPAALAPPLPVEHRETIALPAEPTTLTVPEKTRDDGEITADWVGFGKDFIAAHTGAPSLAVSDAWLDANQGHLTVMKESAPKVYARLMAAVATHRSAFSEEAS